MERERCERKRENHLYDQKKKKAIKVSEFLTPVRQLRVLSSISDHQLLQNKDWLLDENQKSRQYCTKLLEYGKNNYWNWEKMID